jgi:hypothetical protein
MVGMIVTSQNRFAIGALLPFVPVIIGALLKFALVDKVSGDIGSHFVEFYLRPAWIEFLVVAYVSGLAAVLSRQTVKPADIWVFFALPIVCLVISLILVFGLPKAKIESDLWQIYIPGVIAAGSLLVSGGRIGQGQ